MTEQLLSILIGKLLFVNAVFRAVQMQGFIKEKLDENGGCYRISYFNSVHLARGIIYYSPLNPVTETIAEAA